MPWWAGKLREFGGSRSASTAIEYAMIALLIATVIVGALPAIGTGVEALFETLADAF